MFRSKIIALFIATSAVAGCGSVTPMVSRNSVEPVAMEQVGSMNAGRVVARAQELEAMSREILRRTTLQGAAIGAVAGCGLAAVTGSGTSKCVTGALAGGAVGAVAGNAVGQAQVKQRVEIVELSRVMPAVRDAGAKMELMQSDLPALLAAQKAEVAALDAGLADGSVTIEEHAARLSEMRDTRKQLAEALSLTAAQASQAHAALKSAEDQGQTGLAWYLLRIQNLEKKAVSARGTISLL